ncbi:MAG TPA: TetR/AcrR family transcriptional regulator [Jatrophihabitans sp.]|nr:TetR/AcrR family transcriptional regulator [Jatrophihabitans sp.]
MARAQRADACRNRDRLIEVASEVFSTSGVDASLEKIAKQAGVGIGTLYRHFPSRDALIEAVYRHNVEVLCASAEELAATLPPDEALAAWMQNFVAYVPGKKGMSAYLKSVVDADSDLFESTHARVRETVDRLMQAAVEAGTVRPGVDGMELLRGLSGVCLMTGAGSDSGGATVAGLLMDGLRYRSGAAARG